MDAASAQNTAPDSARMTAALLSTYDLGHQPFGLASPAAWLEAAGVRTSLNDLAVEPLDEAAVTGAGLIALYLPMHTATRMAAELLPRLRSLNPSAHICCYGLYAPVNQAYLQSLGADSVLGGEFEEPLAHIARSLSAGSPAPDLPAISLAKQRFRVPKRDGLPALSQYGGLIHGPHGPATAGYTEASRGCKHLCRHCPVVPVYKGQFRIVQQDVVLGDIHQQVAAGARHITFGDPDFFNGPGHAMTIVQTLHREFPDITYDVTIKVEHLLRHADLLPQLVETGCVFVTTAVEAVDDNILAILDKGHTVADFRRAVAMAREIGLVLAPTFVPFTPWTTLHGYAELLGTIADLDLIDHVAPVQLAIRLLVPQGSGLLDLPDAAELFDGYDRARLSYGWQNPDPNVETLFRAAAELVEAAEARDLGRHETFYQLWTLAQAAAGLPAPAPMIPQPEPTGVPRLSEPWFCCAEPTARQFAKLAAAAPI